MKKLLLLSLLMFFLVGCNFLDRLGSAPINGTSVNNMPSYSERRQSSFERRRAADMEVRIINIQNSLHNLEHRRR